METNDITYTDDLTVACDGNNDNNSGHPRIYISIENTDEVVCPYCSRKFVLSSNKKYA